MGSSHHNRSHRLSLAVGISLALATGIPLSALADSHAASVKSEAASQVNKALGIMTFEHVRVVNAPMVSAAPVRAVGQQKSLGMRAYVNEAGQLREQSPDEARQAASETRSVKPAKTALKRSTASFAESNDTQTLYGADGAQGMMLDEESMVFQVAHKNADGTVGQQCVTGEAHVDALHSGATHATHAAKKEVRHDR